MDLAISIPPAVKIATNPIACTAISALRCDWTGLGKVVAVILGPGKVYLALHPHPAHVHASGASHLGQTRKCARGSKHRPHHVDQGASWSASPTVKYFYAPKTR